LGKDKVLDLLKELKHGKSFDEVAKLVEK